MAKRAKSPGKARATFKLFGGKAQNPVGTATFFGKSLKRAEAAGRRFLRNIAAGFYDASGVFHPIRASDDYDRRRVGERLARPARRSARAKRRPARKPARRKR